MSDKTIQVGELVTRILSILGGIAIGVFGHDWTAGAVIIAGGNAGASIAAKSVNLAK